jgi:dihydroorotate dehydrogenase electron transfer subunit
LKAQKIAHKACPGQFVNIKVSDTVEPLLRRPFSIHRVGGLKIEILYERVGKATEILSQRKPGEYLDIIGPLGNGFNQQVPKLSGRQIAILVAGGMGVAPLLFLAQKLKRCTQDNIRQRVLILIGAKTKDDILCQEEFNKIGCVVKAATDDGSEGFKGYVSDLLNEELSTIDSGVSTIYACGPRPMLREVSRISHKYNVQAQISLEEHMACGIGACLGCVIETKQGLQRICKEGPVFNAEQIVW